MGYRCDMCGLATEAGEPVTKEIVVTRKTNYYTLCLRKLIRKSSRKKPNPRFRTIFFHKRKKANLQELKKDGYRVVSETNTTGKETVKENKLCPTCAKIVS